MPRAVWYRRALLVALPFAVAGVLRVRGAAVTAGAPRPSTSAVPFAGPVELLAPGPRAEPVDVLSGVVAPPAERRAAGEVHETVLERSRTPAPVVERSGVPAPSVVPRPQGGVEAVELEVAGPPLRDHRPPARHARTTAGGTCAGWQVKVITSSPDPAWSFATLLPDPADVATLVRPGDTLAGWRVAAIEWDRVELRRGGERCTAALDPAVRQARESFVGGESEGPWTLPEELARSIEKRAEHEFSVTDAGLAGLQQLGARLFAGLHVEPAAPDTLPGVGGEVGEDPPAGDVPALEKAGLVLRHVPEGSLLAHLEVASGDRLLELGDRPPGSPEELARAFGVLRARGVLGASLQRGAEVYRLTVEVRR